MATSGMPDRHDRNAHRNRKFLDSPREGNGFELSAIRQQPSHSAISSVVFGDKTGTIPLSKRGSRHGETSKQFASATEKWGLASTGFGAGRTTRQDREKGIQHSRLEGN